MIFDWYRIGANVAHLLIEDERGDMPKHIMIPLPDRDFDITEVSVPWHYLRQAGHRVSFATENGKTPEGDPLLLTGVIFGQLGADPEPKSFYQMLTKDAAFMSPLRWRNVQMQDFDGLLLPGGHAPGMRQYLGSKELQEKIAQFWALKRPVAAICHGVLVLARSKDPKTGLSLLSQKQTTCLPDYMERLAYYMTSWKLGKYYRTYPAYVESEVKESLQDKAQFRRGPITLGSRGTASSDAPAFVVQDENYLSARWPGDAYLFAKRFLQMLE
jgi:putative intracellular protease/amidase